MAEIDYKRIALDGLWRNNQALVALLGLCPLMAVTNTLINGLGLGLATTAVLLMSNSTVSGIRHWVRAEVRLPVFVMIIASFVTTVELLMNAWFHELYGILGIFIPLIVTNCTIIGRAEAFASRNPMFASMVDALAIGLGSTAVLVVLGGLREFIGQGTLFAGAHLIFGDSAAAWELSLGDDYPGVLLAILPPGAFIGLGFLIAIKNILDKRASSKTATITSPGLTAEATS